MSIIHPATILISGGTGSGKTWLTRKMLHFHRYVIDGLPENPRVIWCYGVGQSVHKQTIPNVSVTYNDGLIDEDNLTSQKPDILVVDDMMSEKANDQHTHNLFTKLSHHLGITVFYLTQNLYERGQTGMKRNAHYLIMMRNPSDKSQTTTLGRQLFPRHKSQLEHFYESYDDATRQKFGYLLIDVSPNSDDRYKLKTNIFPTDKGVIVYVSRQ